ncbi:DUF3429 domain-containing protein [Sphingomonas sp.]|uniref:DUF3429 domain-containing protein n=1 Tax=Sphingomonas sp. TaxID=28214 RepID=UPI003B0060E6
METGAVEEGGGRSGRRVPPAAAALGAAGLLPPLLAIAARLTAGITGDVQLQHFAMLVGLQYVGLILSFLGGLWWGIAVAKLPADRVSPWLALAVLPSLAALGVHVLSNWFPGPSVVLLALCVLATLLVDRRLAREGLAPRWWMRLRVPLSAGLAVLTLVLAALL